MDPKMKKPILQIYDALREKRRKIKREYLLNVYEPILKEGKSSKSGGGDGDEAPWKWAEKEVQIAVKELCELKVKSPRASQAILNLIGEKISKKYDISGPEETKLFRQGYQENLEKSQITLDDAKSLISQLASFKLVQMDDSRWAVLKQWVEKPICILHCGPSAFYVPRIVELDAVHGPENASEVDAEVHVFDDYKDNVFGEMPLKPEPPKPPKPLSLCKLGESTCHYDRPIVFKHGHPDRHYVLDDFGVPTRRYVYVVKSAFQIETLKNKGKVVGRHTGKIAQMLEMAKKLHQAIKEALTLGLDAEKAGFVLETFLSQGDEKLGKVIFEYFYGKKQKYEPEYISTTPVDIFSESELKQYSKLIDKLGEQKDFYEDSPRLDRLGEDLAIVYIHQYQGSGARQRGNALAQTLTPMLSNSALPFGSEDALVFRVDLAQVPVPQPDEPPNLVNFFSKLYGPSLAERMQKSSSIKYDIAWSTAKNREIFLRELEIDWIVEYAKPLGMEMKGEDGAFLNISPELFEQLMVKQDPKRAREWFDPKKSKL
jgi:hypothetical protein